MNLPVLNPVVKNAPLEKIIPDKLFLDLFEKSFEGYIYLTIQGKYGFEESIIIFSKGKIEGLIFLINGYDTEVFGKDAVNYCLNCFGAKYGILNLFVLTEDQIKLVLLFNDKIKYSLAVTTKKDMSILKDIKYNETMIENLLKEKVQKEKTKKEVLDDLGLNDLLRE
ncbi:MAG: hypothetical protein WCX82_03755 [archaeon]|jgi:hypothetical protein